MIADFANQNDIGIVAENGAQPAREGQTGFFRNLNLVDAAHLVFDRILNGDDLAD